MSETFHVNTNKHKMLCTTVILICNKIKNYLQKLIHKNVEVFQLRNHQTNPISRLFIHRAKNKLVK